HRDLHSFPTRRSSDLGLRERGEIVSQLGPSMPRAIERARQKWDGRKFHGPRASGQLGAFGRVDEIDPQTEMDRLGRGNTAFGARSEEHTSELQSQSNL